MLPTVLYQKPLRYDRPFPADGFLQRSTSFAATLHLAEQENRNRFTMCACASLPENRTAATLRKKIKKRFWLDILDGNGSTEILHIYISNRPAE
jgi:hypothetical protein